MSSLPRQPEDLNRDPGELPEALVADLRAGFGQGVAVPPAVDAAILREARDGFARRRRFRLALRAATVTAAAAAVALAFAIPILLKSASSPPRQQAGPTPAMKDAKMLRVEPPAPLAKREDVNHSGTVDILDAYVVARLIEAREALDKTYDINGDGRIDGADVDRIAMAAVDTSAAAEPVAPAGADERRLQ